MNFDGAPGEFISKDRHQALKDFLAAVEQREVAARHLATRERRVAEALTKLMEAQ